MQIAVNLTEDECEVMEIDDIICNYPDGVEIGYLKINPERIPVVVSESIAEAALARCENHRMEADVCGGRYAILADDRSLVFVEGAVIVYGTAYIVRKQGQTYTSLVADEIDDWLYDFEDTEIVAKYFPECSKQDGIVIER